MSKKQNTKNSAAVELGRLGGSARTPEKARSSRENGRLGGRPPKKKKPRGTRGKSEK